MSRWLTPAGQRSNPRWLAPAAQNCPSASRPARRPACAPHTPSRSTCVADIRSLPVRCVAVQSPDDEPDGGSSSNSNAPQAAQLTGLTPALARRCKCDHDPADSFNRLEQPPMPSVPLLPARLPSRGRLFRPRRRGGRIGRWRLRRVARSLIDPLFQFGKADVQFGNGLLQLCYASLLRLDVGQQRENQRANCGRGSDPVFCRNAGR